MHELGITRNLVEIAENHARQNGAEKIISVTVEIGDLSGVIAESVEFCYEACVKGTLLEQAKLIINRIPARARCRDCGTEFVLDPHTFACPECDGFVLDRLQGDELRISEMEIE